MPGYNDWFAFDKEGMAKQVEARGKARVALEGFQNAWDEAGVTEVSVTLTGYLKRGRSVLAFEDDAPGGFADLTHAFTMFAKSAKVDDPTKRGRFNSGEKLLLAICDEATITSTRGGYRFDADGRHTLRRKRERGSRVECVVRMTAAEREEVAALVEMLLPPEGIVTTFNGTRLATRTPVRTFEVTLPTLKADEEGVLRPTKRKTTVRLFEPVGDETPHLYEMGIPVVTHDGRWHIDIAQKVPLNSDRDNVTPAYLREVRVAVLNEAHDLLSSADATTTWVKDAAQDERAEQTAFETVMTQRYGDKRVAYDPSDPDANAEAVLHGYTVVHGGSMSKGEWDNARRFNSTRPAGQVTPSHSKVESSPDGVPPLPVEEWREGHHRVAEYAQRLAKDLLGVDISVMVYNHIALGFDGAYAPGRLSFNQGSLGRAWFDSPDQRKVDALLIHEFAHHKVSDHLSEKFHDECCRLGALLRDSTVRL